MPHWWKVHVAANVIIFLPLGEMHTLMSSIGSIGSLMAESGICKLLKTTSVGVQKVLTEKNIRKYEDI